MVATVTRTGGTRLGALVVPAVLAGLVTARAAPIRFATYNASLNRNSAGQLAADLAAPNNTQAKRVAEIIQRVAPDVVLINEFDFDSAGPGGSSLAAQRFHDNYLAVAQGAQSAITFPHRFAAPSNTGVPTGESATLRGDFDNNGAVVTTPGTDAYGNDCFGFGWFPGQFGMVVFSKFPIDSDGVRTFQRFLWKDVPNPAWPDRSGTPEPADWYTAEEKGILRLSSKSHWDLPVSIAPGQTIHLLAAHPDSSCV